MPTNFFKLGNPKVVLKNAYSWRINKSLFQQLNSICHNYKPILSYAFLKKCTWNATVILLEMWLIILFFFQVELSELVSADMLVVSVSATDRDSGLNGRITYRLLSSPLQGFYIQPDNGKDILTAGK